MRICPWILPLCLLYLTRVAHFCRLVSCELECLMEVSEGHLRRRKLGDALGHESPKGKQPEVVVHWP